MTQVLLKTTRHRNSYRKENHIKNKRLTKTWIIDSHREKRLMNMTENDAWTTFMKITRQTPLPI